MSVIRRRRGALSALVAALVITAVATTVATSNGAAPKSGALSATLSDASGKKVGTVRFVPGRNGRYEVRSSLRSLSPGFHGMHIHEVGICDPTAKDPAGAPAPFSSAGGHLKGEATQTHGAHIADLPPALVMRNGTASGRAVTDRLTRSAVLDADGSAVIVHTGADNLANIPPRYHAHTPDATSTAFGPDAATLATGDAGGRAACGILRRSSK